MTRKRYTNLKVLIVLIIAVLLDSVKAFHKDDGSGHAVYLQANNLKSIQRSKVVQDVKKLKPNENIIVETDEEIVPGQLEVSSTQHEELGVSSTLPPTTTPTTPKSTTKATNKPKVQKKTTVKPIPKSTEQQFSRQQKATETTKKAEISATTKKQVEESSSTSNVTQTTTPLPSTTLASSVASSETSKTSSDSRTELPPATTTITTTTSTAVPPTEKPKSPPNDLYCLCDLHLHACDMNCCCDTDCSEEERSLFSHCEDGAGLHDKRSVPRRQRSCYQSFVFFKHFETQKLQRTEKGMLCILRDNNRDDNELSYDVSEVNINTRKKYEWVNAVNPQYKLAPYQFGSPILSVKTAKLSKELEQLKTFGLPASYLDNSCTVIEPVRFLENVHSRCSIKLENLTRDCGKMKSLDANSIIENVQIVGNPGDEDPQLMTITRGKQCNGQLCTSETEDIEVTEFNSPILNRGKRMCQDVVTRLDFTFFHEGIDGLSEVVVKAQLQDLSLNTTQFFQEYNVNFIWSREEDNNTNVTTHSKDNWPRSGNPGYIVGKPIIFGEKVKILESSKNETKPNENDGQEDKEEYRILVLNDPSRWMTILGPGICSRQSKPIQRQNVLFDYDHSSTCYLNFTRFNYCEDLQIQVAKILFGSDDVNFEKRVWHVAAYGNSNPDILSEWVPLTYKNFPIDSTPKGSSKSLISKGCEGIVSSLHISILYAFVGSVDFPQARITGVLYELEDSIPIPAINDSCTGNKCQSQASQVSVSTTVTFKDVTSPPVMFVAKWPVVSIRLPADFFYPFSSPSSAAHEVKNQGTIIIMSANILFAIFL